MGPADLIPGFECLVDVPIAEWLVEGGALDLDRCPPCWERNAHLERYTFACKALREMRVLDFGCGVGYGSEMLGRSGCRVVATDRSEAALRLARARRPGWAQFVEPADSDVMSQHGAIVAFEVLEHLKDPSAFLKWAAEHSRHLLLSTPIEPTVGNNPNHLQDFTEAEVMQMVGWYFRPVTAWRQLRPWRAEPTYVVVHAESGLSR